MMEQEFSTNFEYYKVFYYTAKYRNITLAAQKLFLTQPSVTKAIQRLEEQLDCQLFLRTKRGVTLTAEGQTLWQKLEPACQMILSAEHELDAMKSLDRGTLTIASTEMGFRTYVLPAMDAFLKRYPNIKVQFINALNDAVIPMLRDGRVDLAVLHSPLAEELDLQLQILDTLREKFVSGPRYRHLADQVQTLDQLREYPFISMPQGSSGKEYMDRFFRDSGLIFQPEITLTTLGLVVQAVESNLGISILPQRMIQAKIAQGVLFPIRLEREPPVRFTYVVTSKTVPLGRAAKAFLEGYLLPTGEMQSEDTEAESLQNS